MSLAMLKIAIMAMVAVLSAVGAARAVVALDAMNRNPAPRAQPVLTDPADATLASAGAAAQVIKAADGHYWAEASVNGSRVKFLVDTGATAVALTLADAQRLGIRPDSLSYDASVTTANGKTRAAVVTLASVAIGGARVDNVDALVIEKGLESSLLGMSYLGRLSRFEATPQALILRQ
jgi:aspartyl protease family protein